MWTSRYIPKFRGDIQLVVLGGLVVSVLATGYKVRVFRPSLRRWDV
jgi:hypothetical protein